MAVLTALHGPSLVLPCDTPVERADIVDAGGAFITRWLEDGIALVVVVVVVATLAPFADSTLAAEPDGPPEAESDRPADTCAPSALLPVGARVRVQSTELPSQRVEGRIVCVSEDFVRLQPDGEPQTITLDREAILSIDVLSASHRGAPRRSRVNEGAAVGAVTLGVLGGTVGVLAGLALQQESGDSGWEAPAASGVVGAASGALVGALVGAAVGAVVPAHSEAPAAAGRPPSAVLAVFPTPGGGAGAAVTIRF
jgi:hypothetical protein